MTAARKPEFFEAFVPQTNVSVKELDQAVAIFAGATTLGFSVYNAAYKVYRAHLRRVKARRKHERQESIRLQELRLRLQGTVEGQV